MYSEHQSKPITITWKKKKKKKKKNGEMVWFGLVWFICLKAYQLLMNYLQPKFD